MIMIPIEQPIYITMTIYINKDGVYSRTSDI